MLVNNKKKHLGIITREVVVAREDNNVQEIARLMRDFDIGVVVIVRDNNNVVGIISERDITRRVVAEGKDFLDTKAQDIMTKEVVSVDVREGLNRIYQVLIQSKFRHLVILDQGKLMGITSRRDLLEGLSGKK